MKTACNCDNDELLYVRFINLTKLEYGNSIYKKKFDCSDKLEIVKNLYFQEYLFHLKEYEWNISTDIIILLDNICDKIYIFNKPEYYVLYYNDDNYFIINQKENSSKNVPKNFISIKNLENELENNYYFSYFSYENFRSKSCCIL